MRTARLIRVQVPFDFLVLNRIHSCPANGKPFKPLLMRGTNRRHSVLLYGHFIYSVYTVVVGDPARIMPLLYARWSRYGESRTRVVCRNIRRRGHWSRAKTAAATRAFQYFVIPPITVGPDNKC